MEAHIVEWLNLLVRWIHFIVGVAWIGASFYFNWLENQLDRTRPQAEGIAGNLWAVHGGGFYHLKKFAVAPEKLPERLHWFKWEAYMTWVSGMCLLAVVYYFNANAFLIDKSVADLSTVEACAIGLFAIIASWYVYDFLCKSSLSEQPALLSASLFVYLFTLAIILSQLFSGRGAYIHVGAAIGTIMVGNVFFVIIPAQRELVNALLENRMPDPQPGKDGLLRSRHNNYLTLPVLFIMISNHFPSTYGDKYNWFVLTAVSLIGIAVRHYFNIRHTPDRKVWILPIAFFAMVLMLIYTAPRAPQIDTTKLNEAAALATTDVHPIIEQRCAVCHSTNPTQPGFSSPPQGLILESVADIESHAHRIFAVTIASNIMPPGNVTGITSAERDKLELWYAYQSQ
ncbi:MAG: urate hydroxylase PuuD [Pseudomonadota bacterium]